MADPIDQPNSNKSEYPNPIGNNIHRIEGPVRQIKLNEFQENAEQKD